MWIRIVDYSWDFMADSGLKIMDSDCQPWLYVLYMFGVYKDKVCFKMIFINVNIKFVWNKSHKIPFT